MNQIGCYILAYYFPEFVRTTTLLQALRQITHLTIYEALNTTRGWLRYWQTLRQLLVIRLRHKPNFYILGFRGYELYWLVRLITWGKPLIFDHMMSPYDSLVNEKHRLSRQSLLAKIVYWYEKGILHNADLILTDTPLHQAYFARLFGIHPDKIRPLHVATDETLFKPCASKPKCASTQPFSVFFYGSFLPLHGIDIILQAAALLLSAPVQFTLVGGHKQDLRPFHALCSQLNLTNVTHIPWIDYLNLPQWACRADLCLGGPFGNTGQGRRVITGKTFQFLALGQPTIIGEAEKNEHFINQHNCLLVPQGDPQALAESIAWAADHRQELAEIGRRGYELYQQEFSVARLREQLEMILQHAILPT
ncbi:MAG: glycosyltransferase [Chloroflexi bacterium]|nr:glycosyltransferase [Chloroflexota bacterium]MBP7043415.1 glycosyltransferase [Chloroflexota bacterium]